MRLAWISIGATLTIACAEQIPERIVLLPAAEDVAIATEPPGSDGYRLVGQVEGQAAANDLDTATQSAKNDLRNKAAALGATLVTIDQDLGQGLMLESKTKVTMTGRAYKPVD
jgi:hypothetical protein